MEQDYSVTVTASASVSKWVVVRASSPEEAKAKAMDQCDGSIDFEIDDVDHTTMEAEVSE